jgi:hypothetical protein
LSIFGSRAARANKANEASSNVCHLGRNRKSNHAVCHRASGASDKFLQSAKVFYFLGIRDG